MSVALVTEATYPSYVGGVSVWVDQLVSGLAEMEFDVIALQGTGREARLWSPPPNVKSVRTIALWGDPVSHRSRRPVRRSRAREAADAHTILLRCLVRPEPWMQHWPPALLGDFRQALQALAEYGADFGFDGVLQGRRATDRMLGIWQRPDLGGRLARRPQPFLSLHDAITITRLLTHLLRPLAMPSIVADIHHATANGLSMLVALAAKWRHGSRIVLTEHGIYLRERYLEYTTAPYSQSVKTALLNFFQLLCALAYEEADLIVPSAEYNRRWELLSGARPSSIRTVHTGVAVEQFPMALTEPAEPTLVYLGRIDPLKDIETLIEAFVFVHRALPNAKLRVFGPVPNGNEAYRERCGALVERLGLGRHITFEGRVARPVDAFHAGHVVVLPSISEGFPYTVLEAMASGRATVSSLVGGVPEAIGGVGLGVPPRDPAAMADACLELLADAPRRQAMGRAARTHVLEHFTVSKMLDAYRDVYAEAKHIERRSAESSPRNEAMLTRRAQAA